VIRKISNNLDAALTKIPHNIDRVVLLAGLSPLKAQLRVYAPLLRRSMAASVLLIFIDTLKELPATLLLAPFNTVTLAVHGYSAAGRGVFEEGAASMLTLVVMSGVATLMLGRVLHRS
jgi:iron(III) transport system permease protein